MEVLVVHCVSSRSSKCVVSKREYRESQSEEEDDYHKRLGVGKEPALIPGRALSQVLGVVGERPNHALWKVGLNFTQHGPPMSVPKPQSTEDIDRPE